MGCGAFEHEPKGSLVDILETLLWCGVVSSFRQVSDNFVEAVCKGAPAADCMATGCLAGPLDGGALVWLASPHLFKLPPFNPHFSTTPYPSVLPSPCALHFCVSGVHSRHSFTPWRKSMFLRLCCRLQLEFPAT